MDTHKSQMTLEPVLQPRRVTMCPRIDSYSSARWSLSACKSDEMKKVVKIFDTHVRENTSDELTAGR